MTYDRHDFGEVKSLSLIQSQTLVVVAIPVNLILYSGAGQLTARIRIPPITTTISRIWSETSLPRWKNDYVLILTCSQRPRGRWVDNLSRT